MTVVHGVHPRSLGSGTEDSQALVQHAYFIAAIVIVFAIVLLRLFVLRRRNQALTEFFRFRAGSQYPYGSNPQSNPNYGSYQGIRLAPLPAAYLPDRRVHAADVDAYGRRLGAGEGVDGKDILPAYDNFDRPPKYIESSWSQGALPQPTEQPSPEGQQGETVHAVSSDSNNAGQPRDDTHAVLEESYGTEVAIPYPTHHDLSNS